MNASDIKTIEDYIKYQARIIEEQGEQIEKLYQQIGDLLRALRKAQEQ
jgi:hypothetical protein